MNTEKDKQARIFEQLADGLIPNLSRDTKALSSTENEILGLYDQLLELRLERAILEAQLDLTSCK